MSQTSLLRHALRFWLDGYKAPSYTRNSAWIKENVKDIFEYIQLDHEAVRLDLMEWGVNTQEFWNVWRLTPSVFRNAEKVWFTKTETKFAGYVDYENVSFCLRAATEIIARKQRHQGSARWIRSDGTGTFVRTKKATTLWKQAARDTERVYDLPEGIVLRISALVVGLDQGTEFVEIGDWKAIRGHILIGYVLTEDCEPAEPPERPEGALQEPAP